MAPRSTTKDKISDVASFFKFAEHGFNDTLRTITAKRMSI